jgi:uncharacterized sodium:solute symporter family permease YidK
MSKPQIQVEMRNKENNLITRYNKLIKLFFILMILVIILVLIVYSGIAVFGQWYNWALIPLQDWLIIACIIIGIFIFLEIIFYLHFSTLRDKRVDLEKIKPEFIDSKRVFIYTFPNGVEGGIFSKTYIKIDNYNVLRLRTLIIPPEEIC